MTTALQALVAEHSLKEVIARTPIRKESGRTPSNAIVEEQEEPKTKPAPSAKKAAAAVARAATKAKKDIALREKAECFVREYVSNGFSASKAYREISDNVTAKSAQSLGSRMLSNVMVQGLLSSHLIQLREKYQVDFQYIWRTWFRHSLATPVDYFRFDDEGNAALLNLGEMSVDAKQNIRKLKVTKIRIPLEDGEIEERQTVEIEVVDQQKAIHEMAQALGMFLPDDDGGSSESMIADMIRAAAARIKNRADLTAHRVVAEQ